MHNYGPQEWVWNASTLTTRLGVKVHAYRPQDWAWNVCIYIYIYRPPEWVCNAASLTTRLGVKCMHIDCKNGCEKTAHIHFLVDMCFNNLGILLNLHSCHLMPLKPGTVSCPKTSQMCNKTVQTGDSRWSLCLLSSSDQGTLFSMQVLRKLQEEEVRQAGIADLVDCPFCSFATIMSDPNDRVFRCLNPECLKDSCRWESSSVWNVISEQGSFIFLFHLWKGLPPKHWSVCIHALGPQIHPVHFVDLILCVKFTV